MLDLNILSKVTKDCRTLSLWAEIQKHNLQNIDAMYLSLFSGYLMGLSGTFIRI
jgi:hypothetical protein